MTTYNVALSNPDDMRASDCPHSFGTGRYLNIVKAASMDDAIEAVVSAAKRDGYYGHDWSAVVTPLTRYGHREGGALSWLLERTIELWDGGEQGTDSRQMYELLPSK